jgi:exopolysaccharide biosynthesis protein
MGGQLLASNVGSRPPRATFGVTPFPALELAQAPVAAGQLLRSPSGSGAVIQDALGSGPSLLSDGQLEVRDVAEGFDSASGVGPTARNPRTGLCWDVETRHVFLLTVDGRQSGWSAGMTLAELGRLMLDQGCDRGLNYDGGGSTTAWVGGAVVNRPSDGSDRAAASAWALVR